MAIQRHSTGQGCLKHPATYGSAPKASTTESFLREFRNDILNGLLGRPKTLPCKYFYDSLGSQLFDEICLQPEYYPTRTELEIMHRAVPEIRDRVGPGSQLVEFGSGSSIKTKLLLAALHRPLEYIPVDISAEYLKKTATGLSQEFPDIKILPIAADFTKPNLAPLLPQSYSRRVIYFPGSTIGNFTPLQSKELLSEIRKLAGKRGQLLIGVDLKKSPAILNAAYNDRAGITARFNLNLLTRINRTLEANFDLHAFKHQALYNEELGRVEMHLISLKTQEVSIGRQVIEFVKGETIHTENSYKYSLDEFGEIASEARFQLQHYWLDPDQLFSVQLFDAV
jgi:dimethylhistidine N-methyltransferase